MFRKYCRKQIKLCIFLKCSLFSTFIFAFDISNVAEPPKSNTVFVGEVLQNGFPVQIKQFYSKLRPVEILSYYKHRWLDNRKTQKNVPNVIERKVAEWTVLSKQKGLYNIVIQVKKDGHAGTEGLISILKIVPSQKTGSMVKIFPRLGGTTLISSTESKDGSKHAMTLILKNSYSVNSNDAFYRAKMEAEEWGLVR